MHLNAPIEVILSCEHGGNKIPKEYGHLFKDHGELLQTHRGLDIGALAVAQSFQEHLQVPLEYCDISRLLIDTNRYLEDRGPFSEISESLSPSDKQKVINSYYQPHWDQILRRCREITSQNGKSVLHLSIHSMTDNFNGQTRSMQLALLFDPKRKFESQLVKLWKAALHESFPDYEIALNEPYRGDDEGMTTYLRTQFDDSAYAGVELELNQGLLQQMGELEKKQLAEELARTLKAAVLEVNLRA